MKPKPLSRSITFWSGVLVIGFIGWAWWQSYFLHPFYNNRGLGISNMGGGVSLARVTHYLGTGRGVLKSSPSYRHEALPPPLFIRGASSGQKAKHSLREPFTIRESWTNAAGRQPGSIRIFIPHWLILLAFAVPWSGLLLWRSRRYRRLNERGQQ